MVKQKNQIIMITVLSAVTTILMFDIFFPNPNFGKSRIIPPQDIFISDEQYIHHLEESVRFDTIDLKIIHIKAGDNFWKIAKKYKVNIDTLIGANPHWDCLTARVNQKIVVPSERGVLHFIKEPGEINELAAAYKVSEKDIIVQNLPPFYMLFKRIFPGKKPVAVFIKNTKPSAAFLTDKLAREFKLREMFRSPLGGRLSSNFGRRLCPIFRVNSFHNGIDIAASQGTPVGASCAGTVTESGWMGGYGKAVMIKHSNGYKTLYGHLSRISVRPGQKIQAGQFVGRVGSTGWSTGPHLHFTLWHNGSLINPLKVLW